MFKPDLDTQASQVIEQIGKIKTTTKLRRSNKKTLRPSEKFALINDHVRTILRAVMRKPNPEVFSQLIFLHGKIKENFGSMSDEALEFLLMHSAAESRGGFMPKTDDENNLKHAVQKFREFLAKDPSTMQPQALSTKIETILAAMAYAYSAEMAETPEQNKMFNKIETLMKDKIVERIKQAYPSRTTDLSPGDKDDFFTVEPEDISSASETEEGQYPLKKAKSKFFKRSDESSLSWPAAAVESGIPIRAHVSASSTLLMPAIEALYDSGTDKSTWFKNDENAKMLSGALLLPTLERASYHSIAETTAGINFYLNERARKSDSSLESKPITPLEAFEKGLTMLEDAASDETTNVQPMSLQRAIRLTKPKLFDLIEQIKAQSTILETKSIKY